MPVRFSLIVPTYNEYLNLQQLYQRIIGALVNFPFDYEIIIVDDDSPDMTWTVAEGLAKKDKRVKVIRRIDKRGLATAVMSGWDVSEGEILGVMDADLQHPPEILEEMLGKIINNNKVDIVVASRYVAGGKVLNRSFQQILRSGFAILFGRIFVPKIFKSVKDPLSGFFILRRKVIECQALKPAGYKILLEVLAIGSYKQVYELPYSFAARNRGRTKAGWQACFAFLLQLIRLTGRPVGNF